MKSVLAIDIGATSGRAVSCCICDGRMYSEELLRFENKPIKERGVLCWDIETLFSNVLQAIGLATQKGEVASIGINTWGVDFAFIDSYGELLSLPVHYRDDRTRGVLEEVACYSSLKDLYFKTGNQLMEINTLFQLIRTREQNPNCFFKANQLLMIPDYLNYLLTGKKVIERSIASTMQLLDPTTQAWSPDILKMFDIPESFLPPLVAEGRILGDLLADFKLGNPKIITVCEHDTASAVVSIPTEEEKVLFISSGTWSLIGTELQAPIIDERSFAYNFTNELGHSGTTTFLKNCTGLWIVEELRRQFKTEGTEYSFAEVTQMVEAISTPLARIDTDSPEFSKPGEMMEKIKAYAGRTHQPLPQTAGDYFKIAYDSLAYKYKEVIDQMEELLEYSFETIYMMGGGSKSVYLSQMVANVTQKVVVTGLTEATAMGNALIQLIALGELDSVREARKLVANSVALKRFYPQIEKE